MSNSPFTTEDKINLIVGNCTLPISGLLGAIAAWIGMALGWGIIAMLTLSLALCLLFLLSPLAEMVRRFVRRKAESYYYGT